MTGRARGGRITIRSGETPQRTIDRLPQTFKLKRGSSEKSILVNKDLHTGPVLEQVLAKRKKKRSPPRPGLKTGRQNRGEEDVKRPLVHRSSPRAKAVRAMELWNVRARNRTYHTEKGEKTGKGFCGVACGDSYGETSARRGGARGWVNIKKQKMMRSKHFSRLTWEWPTA